MFWFIVSSLFMAFAGGWIYLYFGKRGQFDEMEDVKYQMFHEDD